MKYVRRMKKLKISFEEGDFIDGFTIALYLYESYASKLIFETVTAQLC